MKQDITVTVMISYYNQKKYIRDSLQSVLKQKTNFKYEIICGDDGSTDGSYEELLEWSERYPDIISVYKMDRKVGTVYEPIVRVSNNRYNMLIHARGKYITFLDGDDYYTDELKLQKQVTVLENHPDCACCCHSMTVVWDDGRRSAEPLGKISKKAIYLENKIYWEHIWLPAEAFLFRNYYKGKEYLIDNNMFDDNMITVYFIKKGGIIYIPDCMCVYRQISESSWNKRSEMQKSYVNIIQYQESKKILENMDIQCYFRCIYALKFLFQHRKDDWEKDINSFFKVTEKIYVDTLKYSDSSLFYKIWYIIKYYGMTHIEKLVSIKYRLNKLTWKYLKL